MIKVKVSEAYNFENKDGILSLNACSIASCPFKKPNSSYHNFVKNINEFETCYPIDGKMQDIIVKRCVKTKLSHKKQYYISKTHVMHPKKQGPKKTIASIFESTKNEGTRNLTVLAYGNLSLDEAKSIANYLGFL